MYRQYLGQALQAHKIVFYIAYFWVHSRAVASCLALSDLNTRAISGTNGSSGFGSVSREQINSNTFDTVRAGLHWSFKISRQMLPLLFTLQW